jgi:isoamylase/glycogen operon protein
MESLKGRGDPLGVSRGLKGWNFAIFTTIEKKAVLHVFDIQGVPLGIYTPFQTGLISHIELVGLEAPFCYLWAVDGIKELLIDPYSKGIVSNPKWGEPYQAFSLYYENKFDWEGVEPPLIADKDLIIYEVHVRGFTMDPSSQVKNRGTLGGFIEKLPYLKDLGINAIELMPIAEFNEGEINRKNPETGERLFNYWGYSTVHFFAPTNRFISRPPYGLTELCRFVKEAHKLGIKVILDVVFNHTAEGGKNGPIYHFKGIDKKLFYIMQGAEYANYSGCGNTLNANQPIVVPWVIKTLRDYVLDAHIDGFRFDLASCLKRGPNGGPLSPSPLIEAISNDPLLSNTIMIAEPWDAGGFYESGHFYPQAPRWKEWNASYRDDIRGFIKGSPGLKGAFANRLSGSEDLFGKTRTPLESLNFVTCHDGFTLRDLVSYNEKHNLNNGEENRDGNNNNLSWNCGVEGATDNPEIIELRNRQIKNYFLALFISQGVPMMLSGDEYGHTKNGNNNTWCQDNRLNWFQWDTLEKEKGIHHFLKELINYRQQHPHFKKGHFLRDIDITWHGKKPKQPHWEIDDKLLALTLRSKNSPKEIFIAFNANAEDALVVLPKSYNGSPWFHVINTYLSSPDDFAPKDKRISADLPHVVLKPYSAIVLES